MRPGMIAMSLAGLDRGHDRPWAGGVRAGVAWAASLGFRAVALDASAGGVRARDLDRSARRDLAATLRRHELGLAGIDLWIPTPHFEDPERVDRAVAATLGAIELAADLSTLVGGARAIVSVALPDEPEASLLTLIRARADACGVAIADHTWTGAVDRLEDESNTDDPLGVGVDPPTVIVAGDDPANVVAAIGGRLKSARLANMSGGGRVPLNASEGRLDELSYLVALSTSGYERYVIVDLRGLGDQVAAATDAARRLLPHTPSPTGTA